MIAKSRIGGLIEFIRLLPDTYRPKQIAIQARCTRCEAQCLAEKQLALQLWRVTLVGGPQSSPPLQTPELVPHHFIRDDSDEPICIDNGIRTVDDPSPAKNFHVVRLGNTLVAAPATIPHCITLAVSLFTTPPMAQGANASQSVVDASSGGAIIVPSVSTALSS